MDYQGHDPKWVKVGMVIGSIVKWPLAVALYGGFIAGIVWLVVTILRATGIL